MKCPDVQASEAERLKALSEYALDETTSLATLAPVVHIASRMFGMPLSAVNMISDNHVFFAASHGMQAGGVDMRRDVSFCAHAILTEEGMVVTDATQDERFQDNPLVLGASHIRFYAGVPIRSPKGHALGALCVLDTQPHHEFSAEDHARLADLAKMASDRLELRRIEVATLGLADSRGGTVHIIRFDQSLAITGWSESTAQLYGYQAKEYAGLSISDVFCEDGNTEFWSFIRQAIETGQCRARPLFKVRGRRQDGMALLLGLSLSCKGAANNMHFVATLRELSGCHEEGEAFSGSETSDPVTGLKNRQRFYRKVEEAITQDTKAAVVMIDIDGFGDMNDTLGHATGDKILREAASRLQAATDEPYLVARIGGDEFGMLLPDIGDQGRAGQIAQQAIDNLAQITVIDGNPIHITASCGVALAPEHGYEALELIANADLALSKAKSKGRNQLHIFKPELRQAAAARRLHSLELLRASDDSEFVLFYQPQVRLIDGALVGAEALIRWQHPTRGTLAPAVFLPALEEGPLAATVGAWVLDEACAQAARWRIRMPMFRMSVNLFGLQFRAADLAEEINGLLRRNDLPPDALEIELTENIALDNDEIVAQTLHRIRALGVRIAFDDFGTGYASLSSLSRYPITHIKIDRSFVQNLLTSRRDASVVRAILDIARNFEIEAIAEGIETHEQSAYLEQHGCKEGQGHFFGKPVPAHEFEKYFELNALLDRSV